jgi:hypothetical protein
VDLSGLFQWHEEHVAHSLNQPSGFKGKLKFILQLNYFILEIFFLEEIGGNWKKFNFSIGRLRKRLK